MKKNKSYYQKIKREFLLSFFEGRSGYAEKKINGFWLIKNWNGDGQFWQVSVFSPESYERYKNPTNSKKLL
ncbi:MAG: hypothetical protein WC248_03905 [Candidatus Methanomethylophilaceae archaeon]|jgi:hypothetical protein